MKSSIRFLAFRFFVSACVAVLLVSCGPVSFPGLDSVSPDGRTAVVIEAQKGSSQMVILNLDTGKTSSRQAADLIPLSSFSPDHRYLVVNLANGLTLFDASRSTSEGIRVGDAGWGGFLPNGDLLLAQLQPGNIRVDRVVPGRAPPIIRELLAEADLAFPSTRSLMKLTVFGRNEWPDSRATLLTSSCTELITRDQISWILLARDYSASVLTASRKGTELKRLDPSMYRGLTVLLNQQKVNYQDEIASQAGQLEAEIKQAAAKEGRTLSDVEVKSQVAAQVQAAVWDKVTSSISGLTSPDGMSLFFLRVELATQNPPISLFLVPLNGSEFPVPLTTRADWFPQFDFSPDGKQIFFESNLYGARGFYVANSDGSNIQRLPIGDATNVCWN